MQSIKCEAKALFMLSLVWPAMAMASETMPQPAIAPQAAMTHVEPIDFLASEPSERGHIIAAMPETIAGMGATVASDQLETYRGGNTVSSSAVSTGLLQEASAVDVVTGNNSITGGAFAHASGLPIVIQNSGANVLIQNSTIVNVQFR